MAIAVAGAGKIIKIAPLPLDPSNSGNQRA
jgi:hypothetical protein